MKEAVCVLTGIFTFSVGCWFCGLRPLLAPVSLCEIAENISFYESKQIHVKAFLANGGYYDLVSGVKVTDFRNGCATEVNIEITKELKIDDTFLKVDKELFEKKRELHKVGKDGWAIVEVEFVGELEDKRKNGSFDKPYFVIKPSKIRQISSVNFITPNEVSVFNNDLLLD